MRSCKGRVGWGGCRIRFPSLLQNKACRLSRLYLEADGNISGLDPESWPNQPWFLKRRMGEENGNQSQGGYGSRLTRATHFGVTQIFDPQPGLDLTSASLTWTAHSTGRWLRIDVLRSSDIFLKSPDVEDPERTPGPAGPLKGRLPVP